MFRTADKEKEDPCAKKYERQKIYGSMPRDRKKVRCPLVPLIRSCMQRNDYYMEKNNNARITREMRDDLNEWTLNF